METVTIGACTHGNGNNPSEITLKNLQRGELDTFIGMVAGMYWVAVNNGRLLTTPRHQPLPSPTDDEEMMPFWRRHEFPADGKLQVSIFDPERLKNNYGASIQIESLCGYHYTKANYQLQAEKLTSYGFNCLRSRRGDDGKFWEIWHLPGTWAAKGALAEKLAQKKKGKEGYPPQEELQDAISFLCVNSQFGSLTATVQRACMVHED